jgi:hypothetical protein
MTALKQKMASLKLRDIVEARSFCGVTRESRDKRFATTVRLQPLWLKMLSILSFF